MGVSGFGLFVKNTLLLKKSTFLTIFNAGSKLCRIGNLILWGKSTEISCFILLVFGRRIIDSLC